MQLAEGLLGNPFIPPLGEPAAAVVATTHVQAEGDPVALESGDNGIVGGNVLGNGLIRIDAQFLPLAPPLLVPTDFCHPVYAVGSQTSAHSITSWVERRKTRYPQDRP